MTGERMAFEQPSKKQRATRQRRLGDFSASAFSKPNFGGEKPISLEDARGRQQADHERPGEAILTQIDTIAGAAYDALRKLGGKPLAQPATWSNEAVPDLDLDTPHGFALRVASMSGSIRERVMNLCETDDRPTLDLIRDALDLAASFHALQMEFVNGPSTARGRAVVAGAKLGGEDRSRIESLRRDHAMWKAEADRVRSERPTQKKMEIARSVKRRLGLNASLRTICRRI